MNLFSQFNTSVVEGLDYLACHEYWQLQYEADNPLRSWSQLFTHTSL